MRMNYEYDYKEHTVDEPPKIGRPRIHFSREEQEEAQKGYRKTWYQKNKEHVKENRNILREKQRRQERTKSGYFAIYSDDDMYIGFSKDIRSRCADIIKNVRNNNKHTSFYNRFDPNKNYDWRILALSDAPSSSIHDLCIENILEKNTEINFI